MCSLSTSHSESLANQSHTSSYHGPSAIILMPFCIKTLRAPTMPTAEAVSNCRLTTEMGRRGHRETHSRHSQNRTVVELGSTEMVRSELLSLDGLAGAPAWSFSWYVACFQVLTEKVVKVLKCCVCLVGKSLSTNSLQLFTSLPLKQDELKGSKKWPGDVPTDLIKFSRTWVATWPMMLLTH